MCSQNLKRKKKPEPAGQPNQPARPPLPHQHPEGQAQPLASLTTAPPLQGDTPRQRAEKAQDTELAAYLEDRQHYQMIQREDQETAV